MSPLDIPERPVIDLNRIAWFDMSWQIVGQMVVSQPMHEIQSTLPDDLQVVRLVLDDERRTVRVFYLSAENEPVPESALIPEVSPLLTRTDA